MECYICKRTLKAGNIIFRIQQWTLCDYPTDTVSKIKAEAFCQECWDKVWDGIEQRRKNEGG